MIAANGEEKTNFSSFPYIPYPEQVKCMEAIWLGIQNGGVSIIESPTGTGKTLMLLAGAYEWLLRLSSSKAKSNANLGLDEPDWVTQYRASTDSRDQAPSASIPHPKKSKSDNPKSDIEKLLSLLPSDVDDTPTSPTVSSLFASLQPKHPKIFYASRTHSQLAQVFGELRRLVRPEDNILAITMAGRSCLCINDRIRSAADPGESCLAALKDRQCPYYHEEESVANMNEWLARTRITPDHAPKIVDIEEAVTSGRALNACPYYGVRAVQQEANIIALPYSLIFDPIARHAAQINLLDSLIIIDEAHNLVDYINQAESKRLRHRNCRITASALTRYLEKYGRRFVGPNLSLLKQLLIVVSNLCKLMEASLQSTAASRWSVLELMREGAFDTINLVKIIEYCNAARLAYKLDYEGDFPPRYHLLEVTAFLGKLAEQSSNGRIIRVEPEELDYTAAGAAAAAIGLGKDTGEDGPCFDLKYVNVNPAEIIKPIVESAHAVILAGGTMSPLEDLVSSLFGSDTPVKTHVFGHVLSEQRFLVHPLASGPTGYLLDCRHERRGDPLLWREIGSVAMNLARVTPESMCIFFASSTLLSLALEHWHLSPGTTTTTSSTIERLKSSRPGGLFIEDKRSGPAGVEQMLEEYSQAKSAILLAIVGGRLSEGINLSDGLCRCLMLVGIPFPNEADPEVQERKLSSTFNPHNQSMRRVNQTIGRALRHKDDYAAIVLCDHRYSQERYRRDLPKWMQSRIGKVYSFPQVFRSVSTFFKTPL